MPTSTLTLQVHDETKVIFKGEIQALSSVNDHGPFDILGEHANFITLISQKIVLHLTDGQQKEIPIESGVLRCISSKVEIYLGV